MKIFGWSIIGIVIITGIVWLISANDYFLYKFWAPKNEAVRREVFENTKSYKQGTIQELRRWQFEYIKAPNEQKGVLASTILHQIADFDRDLLPLDLREFVSDLERQQNTPVFGPTTQPKF